MVNLFTEFSHTISYAKVYLLKAMTMQRDVTLYNNSISPQHIAANHNQA